jgi:NADPH2:quinone reductase
MTQTVRAEEKTMKAVALDSFGGPEKLKVQTIPVPEVGDDEVLIQVHTAGVGAWDPYERDGGFVEYIEGEPRFPYVLGSEGSGTVASVGTNVNRFAEGDKVYASPFLNPKGGFYSQYAVVNSDLVSHIPGDISIEQAAVFSGDGLTALRGLDDTLKLKSGESIMIFGASGGIGHLAVQLAKRMGARVFAVASGEDGVELAKRIGADAAVNGRDEGILKAALEFAPDGIDAALVTAGGEATNRALSAIRPDGRVAYPNGVMPVPEPPHEMTVEAYDGAPDREILERLNNLVEAGPFEVHIDKTFPLDQAAEAQEALDKHHLGKLALRIQ